MTDGIIQKTIDKYRKKTFITKHAKFEVLELKDLNKLQQELIEKIKQEFPTDEIPDKSSEIEMIPVGNINIEVSRILIGDNQE